MAKKYHVTEINRRNEHGAEIIEYSIKEEPAFKLLIMQFNGNIVSKQSKDQLMEKFPELAGQGLGDRVIIASGVAHEETESKLWDVNNASSTVEEELELAIKELPTLLNLLRCQIMDSHGIEV